MVDAPNYLDEKHRGVKQRRDNAFLDVIVAVGCATNIVVAVAFCRSYGAEINYFEQLMTAAKKAWPKLRYVLADGLYSDPPRIEQAIMLGMRLLSPTRYGKDTYKIDAGKWLWNAFNDVILSLGFDAIYRYRSKIESVFSAIKRTMGWHLRIRLTKAEKERLKVEDEAQRLKNVNDIGVGRENELLARFIVWNLRVLIILEFLHDEKVDFVLQIRFQPFPRERFSDYHPLTGEAPPDLDLAS